jgi:copper(I)-binding protein
VTLRLAPVLALAVCAGALTGCGTGLEPQTYKGQNRAFSPTAVGSVEIRNIGVTAPISGEAYAAGENVIVSGSLVNPSDTDDALVGATSSAAGSADLLLAGDAATSIPVPARGQAPATWAVLLKGLKSPLSPGSYVTVTLTFEKAGRTKELLVPVRSGDNGLSSREESQDPYKVAE